MRIRRLNKKCCVRAFTTVHKHSARCLNQHLADLSSFISHEDTLRPGRGCRTAECFAGVVVSPAPQIGGCPVIPLRAVEADSFQEEEERKNKTNKPVRNAGKPIHPAVPRPHSNREASCAVFLFLNAAVLIVWIMCNGVGQDERRSPAESLRLVSGEEQRITTARCKHRGGPPRDMRDNNFLTREGGRNYLDKTFLFFFGELSFHNIRAHVKHELRKSERARWKLPWWSSGFC